MLLLVPSCYTAASKCEASFLLDHNLSVVFSMYYLINGVNFIEMGTHFLGGIKLSHMDFFFLLI